ncbi:MAG TPA: FkbM family methyltransferase [Gemmataceae bacterium]|nr:FkbM family methyltransferase [Gemmataceae bacterium]
MSLLSVAIIFDNQVRPDTTGGYCLRALQKLVTVKHFLPSELNQVPRQGFDLYLNIDDGLEYRLPTDLRPCAWWAIDTHLNPDWCLGRARDFDFIFTAQRDGADQMQDVGIETACWLPLACDPEIHRKHDVPKTLDFCFVGHVFPGPRAELLDLLQRRFRNHFVGQRFFEEMARTYSASRIVFNRSIRNDINMRVFEALACGSLLLTNDLEDNGQGDMFRDGTHLATYRDAHELMDKVGFYLARETVREQIAARGREEVLAKDTYRHRIELLLREVARGLAKGKPVPLDQKMPFGNASSEKETTEQPSAAGDHPAAQSTPGPSEGGGAQAPSAPGAVTDILDLIPRFAGKILEIAHGNSGHREAIQKRQAGEVTQIEILESPVPGARSRFEQVVVADGKMMNGNLTASAFDAIVCDGVLEGLRDPAGLLRKARGWLNPDGQLVAKIANVRHHNVVRALLAGHWPFPAIEALGGDSLRFYTRREAEKLFYRAGFAVQDIYLIPSGDDQDNLKRAESGEVRIGPLQVTGLPPEEAQECCAIQYLMRAVPVPFEDYGLTSIIILAHDQLAYTRLCIDSIRHYTDEPYELILVDNGSTDGTAEYFRSLKGAKVISNPDNRGFPAAVNQGIQIASGRQILLLNNDTLLTTGWLRRLLRALHSDAKIGLVGPCSNFVGSEQQVSVTYQDLIGLDGFAWDWGKANNQGLSETNRLIGFCLLIRREVIDTIGLFDEQFGVGSYEDDDYCRRAAQAGFKAMIAQDAFVHHFGGRTFVGAGVDFRELMQRNERLYRDKWMTTAPAQQSKPPAAQSVRKPYSRAFRIRAPPGGGLLLERERVQVSLCMIVRDNARTIEACLTSIKPWVDEMVVVDTGSKDETPAIAKRLGARVYDFPWCDSFAAARNESIRHARGEWIFWMDSDDTMDADNGRKLRDLMQQPVDPSIYGFIMQVHCPGAGEDGETDVTVVDHVKLFRNLPELRFERRIHEQVLRPIRHAGGEVVATDIFVVHSGYDHSPEGQERKKIRDLHLLELELADNPNEPFTLFNLGMTYADLKQFPEAMSFLRRSIAVSGPEESHLRKAYALLVYTASQLGNQAAAREACEEGLSRFPSDLELRFRKALLLQESGRLQEAAERYEDVLRGSDERYLSSMDRGISGFKTRQNLAVVYEDMGNLARAEEEWRKVTNDMPRYRAGWQGLGETLLKQEKLDGAFELAQRLQEEPHLRGEGLVLLGQVLARRGDLAGARSTLDQAGREFPNAVGVRQARSRFLFEHGPEREAEGALKKLAELTPHDGAVHHNLGALYQRTGRPSLALEAYGRSLQERPDSPGTYLQLGHVLQGVGKEREANDAWKRYQELLPAADRPSALARNLNDLDGTRPKIVARAKDSPSVRVQTVRLRGRTISVPFHTRGPVDESILEDVCGRDAYGIADIEEAPRTVVDIGAHIGAFSLMASEAWPEARIIACEADPDNYALLQKNVSSHPRIETVEAAIVAEDTQEVSFNRVIDKARGNSGGGSCCRPEPGSIPIRIRALEVVKLWRSKRLASCDLLKLDCEGAEVAILQALVSAGLLESVKHILGEWHAQDNREESRRVVKHELNEILRRSHDVVFLPHKQGREGHFSARVLSKAPRLVIAGPT